MGGITNVPSEIQPKMAWGMGLLCHQ